MKTTHNEAIISSLLYNNDDLILNEHKALMMTILNKDMTNEVYANRYAYYFDINCGEHKINFDDKIKNIMIIIIILNMLIRQR